mmetsp:Transcript_33532/g.113858  ORF Transcript_33532/g.113858 Transcript_33532/m.113858 type:complete len:287 (+) Transcript_33532:1834-2694(+)
MHVFEVAYDPTQLANVKSTFKRYQQDAVDWIATSADELPVEERPAPGAKFFPRHLRLDTSERKRVDVLARAPVGNPKVAVPKNFDYEKMLRDCLFTIPEGRTDSRRRWEEFVRERPKTSAAIGAVLARDIVYHCGTSATTMTPQQAVADAAVHATAPMPVTNDAADVRARAQLAAARRAASTNASHAALTVGGVVLSVYVDENDKLRFSFGDVLKARHLRPGSAAVAARSLEFSTPRRSTSARPASNGACPRRWSTTIAWSPGAASTGSPARKTSGTRRRPSNWRP